MYYEYGIPLTRVHHWSKITLIEIEMEPTELALIALELEDYTPRNSNIFTYPPPKNILAKLLDKYLRIEVNLVTNVLRGYSIEGKVSDLHKLRSHLDKSNSSKYLVLMYNSESRCIDYSTESIGSSGYFTKVKKLRSLHDLIKLKVKLGIK
jgi:hypothetical protein